MNDVPLVEVGKLEAETLAERFDVMAERIRLNKDDSFGGAFVIVPPLGGGEPIETLVLDREQDPAQFWAILKTKAEMHLAALDQLARSQQAGFGRR